jgi:hypothetical protein
MFYSIKEIPSMKTAIDFLVKVSIVALVVTACNSVPENNSIHIAMINSNDAENNVITFKVNGETVKTTGWNITRFEAGNKVQLNITSNMHIDKRTISVNLSGDKAGIYRLTNDGSFAGSSYGSYAPDYGDLLTRYSFDEGKFNITEIDTVKGIVNGTFEGVVRNLQGNSFKITDGEIINGELKPGIQKF